MKSFTKLLFILAVAALLPGCEDEAGTNSGSRGNATGSPVATPGENEPDGNDSSNDSGGL